MNESKEGSENNDNISEILSISLWLKIKFCICPRRINEKENFFIKLYEKSIEIINNKMDVIDYLNFRQEYTHLKCLLFDDVHSLCLSYLYKPKVYEKNIMTKIFSKDDKKLSEIINFFKNKTDFSEKDKRIYNILSEDVKCLIKI